MTEAPQGDQPIPEAAPAAASTSPPVVDGQAAPVAFDDLGSGSGPRVGAAPLESLLDMSVDVSIRFGRAQMMVQDVLALGPGSVVQLDRTVGEPIDVYVSDRKFGEGEIVVIGDHFGIRLTKVASPVTGVTATAV